ncbi:hypothetical protein [Acidovorax lacteus]|uniref:Uncharacterized protein n=1 Tax=Acidovorax lacteus TaxID=1924988 RepID=A0ABP8LFL8_9BURK
MSCALDPSRDASRDPTPQEPAPASGLPSTGVPTDDGHARRERVRYLFRRCPEPAEHPLYEAICQLRGVRP